VFFLWFLVCDAYSLIAAVGAKLATQQLQSCRGVTLICMPATGCFARVPPLVQERPRRRCRSKAVPSEVRMRQLAIC
jgi:hypothetical protein